MRGWIVAAAVFAAACGQQPAKEAPETAAEEAAPEVVRPEPLSLERTAVCASALDTFKSFGKGAPPAGVSIESFGDAALITLRAMEVSLTDEAGYKTAYDKAKTAWADQTPAEIEAAVVGCLNDVRG